VESISLRLTRGSQVSREYVQKVFVLIMQHNQILAFKLRICVELQRVAD
jgi:hypothetical protein